jgi:hypothetical protein
LQSVENTVHLIAPSHESQARILVLKLKVKAHRNLRRVKTLSA